MCTSTKKGVWAGEEDEIRGSHLDWRLEIVEGQRGLWSVTQATALAKKKKAHSPAEPDRGVRLCCLALLCFAPLLVYFFAVFLLEASQMGPLTYVTGRWWKPLREEKIMGYFFARRISWESVPHCVWSRLRLNSHAQLRGGLVVLRGHCEKTLILASLTVMIFINLGAVWYPSLPKKPACFFFFFLSLCNRQVHQVIREC